LLSEKMPGLAPRTAQAKAFAHLLTIKCFPALRHVDIFHQHGYAVWLLGGGLWE
jgi:hypothetical protein